MLTINAHVHSHTSTPTRAKSIQSYTPTLIPPGVPDARAACDMHVPAHPESSIELACGNTRGLHEESSSSSWAGWASRLDSAVSSAGHCVAASYSTGR